LGEDLQTVLADHVWRKPRPDPGTLLALDCIVWGSQGNRLLHGIVVVQIP
jgi:hypothetical protein